MAKDKDPELAAMTKCAGVLGELDPEPRSRVMWWLNEKFPAALLVTDAEQSVSEFPLSPSSMTAAERARR
jgi:hypothetical protein